MFIFKCIIFFLAIYLTWIVISRFINSMALIIKTGQPRDDQSASFIVELFVCILWTVFYII